MYLDWDPTHPPGEYRFLIGSWTCRVTENGKRDAQSKVTFEWLYDGNVLKETVNSATYAGQFMTVLDMSSGMFKGVAVGNDGSYIVWETAGLTDNKSTEVGYLFGNGKMTAVSRSDFEKVSETHYIIRDFRADTSTGKGPPTDTEDCLKDASGK